MSLSVTFSVHQKPTHVYKLLVANNRKRQDLEIRGVVERGMYADVLITDHLNKYLTFISASNPLRTASLVETKKVSTYAATSQAARYHFTPIVLRFLGTPARDIV